MMDAPFFPEDYLRSIDVHDILPQAEPFVMVGCMTAYDGAVTVTETVVREDNIFLDGGVLSPFGVLENIAQTCAARTGFYNKYILHKEVQVGFIGAVRNFNVYALPTCGSIIVTKVEILEDIFGMTLARAIVTSNGEKTAVAEMKLSVRTRENQL